MARKRGMPTTIATTPIAVSRTNAKGVMAPRQTIGLWVLSLVLLWQPLQQLAMLAWKDENSSHIVLIPLVSAVLIYLRRKHIFRQSSQCPSIGLPLLLMGLVFWGLFQLQLFAQSRLAMAAVSVFLVWNGIFL